MVSALERRGIRPSYALLLILIAAAAFVPRIAATAEPLGIDQSLWASAVRGMSRGQLLYRDVWEQRPPGIYWIYLWGFRLFGWKAATVAWLDLLAAAATTSLLFLVVKRLATPAAGLLAASLYAVLTLPAWLYGHGGFLERSVCETFTVVLVAAAAYSASFISGVRTALPSACAGLLCGGAVVLKPNAGLYLPAVLAWAWFYRRPEARAAGWLARMLVWAAMGAAIVPVLGLLWLWRLDLLGDARTAVLDFNRYYVGEGFGTPAHALAFAKAAWLRIKTDPLWLAGAVGAVVAVSDLARRRRVSPAAGLAVVWGAAAALVIVANGSRLFNSYFINALPPLAVLGGWLLGDISSAARVRRLIAFATVLLMAVVMIQRNFPGRVYRWTQADLAALTGRLDRTSQLERFGGYANDRGYSARANAELADYIRERTRPDEKIYLFGINGAGVYFSSDRLTAHRFLRVNFFIDTEFPDPRFRLGPVINDLIAAQPRYVIFERLHSSSAMGRLADALPDDPEVQRLLSHYALETTIEDFAIYRKTEP